MTSLPKSRVFRANAVTLLDKKLRLNPDGFLDELNEDKIDGKGRQNELSGWTGFEEQQDDETRKKQEREREIEQELRAAELLRDQIISEAKKEAGMLTIHARVEADKMIREAVSKAEEERERIQKEAHDAGYEEGIESGRAEGEKLKAEGSSVLEEAKKTRQDMIENLEPELVDFTVSVAEKLVHQKAAFNPALVLNLIRAGLAESISAASADEISLMVSEEDYPTVNDSREELLKMVGGGVRLEIIRDPSLNKSDCIIKTPFGYIDTSLGQSFEQLRENLYLIRLGEKL